MQLNLLDDILEEWGETIGGVLPGYRNHCCRVVSYCCTFDEELSDEELRKLQVAAAFHDLGLWAHDTTNYLEPSCLLAETYLKKHGLEGWMEEVFDIIRYHHKITPYRGDHRLAEIFRKADWVDASRGVVSFGISSGQRVETERAFPLLGFFSLKNFGGVMWRSLLRNPIRSHPFRW